MGRVISILLVVLLVVVPAPAADDWSLWKPIILKHINDSGSLCVTGLYIDMYATFGIYEQCYTGLTWGALDTNYWDTLTARYTGVYIPFESLGD